MNNKLIYCLLAFVVGSISLSAQDPLVEKKNNEHKPEYIYPEEAEVRENISNWQNLKFGMFIHWGTYSQWGIVESWSICPEAYKFCMVRPDGMSYDEYVKKYEALKNTFNPVKFDPEKWASAAQYAGMKYVVFTTKHHDGFNMYNTAYSNYKVTDKDCPFHTNANADIAARIFDAFRDKGMMAGAYYSIADWNNNDYWWDYFPPKDRNLNYPPEMFPEKWQRLNDFINNQLDELTGGRYGKLGMLWFDLCDASPDKHPQWDRFAKTVRSNQPDIMMVARHQNNIYENYRTPEQKIPDQALDYPWESCMTMATQWSYKPDDIYKSTHSILTTLVQIVSRGGNLLLNVGPGPDGELHPDAYRRLREIGDWMQVNGEGIYGTRAIAPYKEERIAFTSKGNYVYAFFLSDENEGMPGSIKIRSFVPQKGKQVTLLGSKIQLKWKKTSDGIEIIIPERLRRNPPCKMLWGIKIPV